MPFHTRREKEHRSASISVLLGCVIGATGSDFHRKQQPPRPNGSLVRRVPAPLRFPRDQPDTCSPREHLPGGPMGWGGGAGEASGWRHLSGSVDGAAAAARRRAEPAGWGEQSIFHFTFRPTPLRTRAPCLQSCESSRGDWPWGLAEPKQGSM